MFKESMRRFVAVAAVVGVTSFGGVMIGGTSSVCANEAAAPAEEPNAVILTVSGMTCGACSNKVKTALNECDGVLGVDVSHKSGKAVVKVKEGTSDAAALIEAVKKAGFKAES